MLNSYYIPYGPLFLKKLYCNPSHGLKKILGIYEIKITKVLKKLINTNDIILDIGSHIGYTSMLMSKFTGNNGKVYAIDPSKENYEMIKKTISSNKIKNITPILKAIGQRTETKDAYYYEDSKMYNITDSGFLPNDKYHDIQSIETIRLDDFINIYGINKIDFIKIDIEGYETILVETLNDDFFLKFNAKFLIEIHDPLKGNFFHDFFRKYNYSMKDLNLKIINKSDLSSYRGIYHAIFVKDKEFISR